jgi:exocyst complex component 2
MTVVQELDKTLFEGYSKPKADNVTNIIRVGILDSGMDWYDTPQPTGPSCLSECMRHI